MDHSMGDVGGEIRLSEHLKVQSISQFPVWSVWGVYAGYGCDAQKRERECYMQYKSINLDRWTIERENRER